MDTAAGPLYIPVILNALRVGVSGPPTADLTPNYSLLEYDFPVGNTVQFKCFAPDPQKPGIHLHWTLPDALTHAVENKDGGLDFPVVPNRWLVQRLSLRAGAPEFRAWIIESDYLTNDPKAEYTPNGVRRTTIPAFRYDAGKKVYVGAGNNGEVFAYMGDCREFGSIRPRDDRGYYLKSLTAVGPGDPLFSALYPRCRTVFGFYDNMAGDDTGLFTYCVTGWYASPDQDPLNAATAKTLAAMRWSVSGGVPAFSVCHGLVDGVEWRGPGERYPSGMPGGSISLSLGNTSAEALSAVIQKNAPELSGLERLFTGLQYNHLRDLDDDANPDALIEFEEMLHENQFSSLDGGGAWLARRTGEQPGALLLDEEERKLLRRLVRKERNAEQLRDGMHSLQEEIHFLWCKYVESNDPFGKERNPARLSLFTQTLPRRTAADPSRNEYLGRIAEILDQLAALERHEQSCRTVCAALRETLDKALAGKNMSLAEIRKERYRLPNAPALMLSGQGVQRGFSHGFQSDAEGWLPCRLKTVGALTVEVEKKNVSIGAADILACCPGLKRDLPAAALAVSVEGVLLAGMFSRFLAVLALKAAGIPKYAPAQLDAAESAVRKARQAVLASVAAPFAPSFAGWKQPWTPLLLEWDVELHAARTTVKPDDAFSRFALGEIDLEPAGGSSAPGDVIELLGATQITPHAVMNAHDMIMRLIEEYGGEGREYDILKKAAASIKNLDILSQRLDGFNEALIMRDNVPCFPPCPDDEDERKLLARMSGRLGAYAPSPRILQSNKMFLPVRAGKLRLRQLWLVDGFGQYQTVPVEKPIIAETLRDADTEKALLRPRVLAPCRVEMEWLDAKRRSASPALDAGSTPLCGLVSVNFIDCCIQIHDAEGAIAGVVQLTDRDVKWVTVPGGKRDPDAIPDRHLRHYAKVLLAMPANDFLGLLAYFDHSFNHIHPADDDILQLGFGRIMALVRARLSVSLRGHPPSAQTWDIAPELNAFDEEHFSVRLGDGRKVADGLLGFFHGEDSAALFKQMRICRPMGPLPSGHLLAQDSIMLSLAAKPQIITLLMQPKCAVTVRTGFQPARHFTLPEHFHHRAVDAMDMHIRTMPVLTRTDAFSLPIPGGAAGEWIFTYVDEGKRAAVIQDILPPGVLPPSQRQHIAEGFYTARRGNK